MSDSTVYIGERPIGREYPPFIVAEMSGNHNQSVERAMAIIDAAAAAGVHAVKLQTYTADTMTLDISEREFLIDEPSDPWKGRSMYELYLEAYTPWEWHEPLFNRCKHLGLMCFSAPFDASSVDFLEELGTPAYKIASFENTDLPLIRKAASTGKPLIISTGMSSVAELAEAVETARLSGCRDLILLKCTSTYPAESSDANLRTIMHMSDLFDVPVGLSDHTMGIGTAVAAVAMGAAMIEKHFTLSRADGGVDAAFSAEPEEMTSLVMESGRAWQSMGHVQYGPTDREKPFVKDKRSIYFVRDCPRGKIISDQDVRIIRPGYGLAPKYMNIVLGSILTEDIRKGTPVSWKHLSISCCK